MKLPKSALLAVGLAALALPQLAEAQQEAHPPACLNAQDVSALTAYALPTAIIGTAAKCVPNLGAESWLARNGADLAQRYSTRKAEVWPAAKAAFVKVALGNGNGQASQLVQAMPDDTVRGIVDGAVTALVGEKIPAERCSTIDRLAGLIAPLPPENAADLVAVILGLVSRDGKFAKLPLCHG